MGDIAICEVLAECWVVGFTLLARSAIIEGEDDAGADLES